MLQKTILMLGLFTSPLAFGAGSFKTEIKVTAPLVAQAEKSAHLCYRLAAEGQVIGEERVPTRWFETMNYKEYVWRVTSLSSGLICKELIEGKNELQWGSGINKVACSCEGLIEVAK